MRICIDSLLKQSYQNIEIILVNDGSIDQSQEICNEYSRMDDRIKVIHKQNAGLMNAWITGVNVSTGDYIGFVDGDDWVSHAMYESMVDKVNEHDSDLVVCGFYKDYGVHGGQIAVPVYAEEGLYTKDKLHTQLYTKLINVGYGNYRGIGASRANKLIRRDLVINNIKYCDNRITYGEDLNITVPVALDANKIYVMKNSFLYHYRQNPTSITNSPTYKKNLWNACLLLNEKLKIAINEKKFEELSYQLEVDLIYLSWTSLINETRSNTNFKNIYRCMKKIINNNNVRHGFEYLQFEKMTFKEKLVIHLIKSRMILLLFIIFKVSDFKYIKRKVIS